MTRRSKSISHLLSNPTRKTGLVQHIMPESAGWIYVGFDLHKLAPGESASAETHDREVCLVFVSGKGRVLADGTELGELGERMSPFEGKPYLPEFHGDIEPAMQKAPNI